MDRKTERQLGILEWNCSPFIIPALDSNERMLEVI